MKHMREAAVAGALRTPFVKPGSAFSGVPEADIIRLIIGELLFSFSIEPSSIDTVFVSSSCPLREKVLRDLRSAFQSLGFSGHLRLITVRTGGISDLVALTAAVTRVSTGDSDVSLVVGAGLGEEEGAGGDCREEPARNHFPCHGVIERYPSTYRDRLAFRKESDRKVRGSSADPESTGMISIGLPPFFDHVVGRDDLVDCGVENISGDDAAEPEELPDELVLDFTAPRRRGAGAVILTSLDGPAGSDAGSPLRITGYSHAGVPPDLGGLGAAVALESLLTETGVTVDQIDVLEILELTGAQTISSLEHLKSLPPGGETVRGDNGNNGRVLNVNPHGGSLVYGFVPSCSGVLMIASLFHQCNKTDARVGAVLGEDPSGEAVAMTVEKV